MLKKFGYEEGSKCSNNLKSKFRLIKTLAPSVFVLGSIMVAFIIQLVCFPIAKKVWSQGPALWEALRNISLPKSLLWYYLIVNGASIFIHPEEATYLYSVIMNATYISGNVFMFYKELTLLVYLLHKKSVPKGFACHCYFSLSWFQFSFIL